PHQILCAGSGLWPFAIDPDPPVLLFVAGNLELLAAPDRVAVVGTRRCSAVGRSVAREIGFTLADAGVSVVSGLALGIDGAAHDGAGAAPGDPGRVGVVAGGLDMVYPPAHGELWRSIAATGLLMSETPMGERATRWRFPARNRLIAALSQVVVVVESHRSGGALLTVEEALGRSIDVCSVPGSVLSQSSAGSNQLLLDGIPPVRNGSDVLDLLGWSHSQQPALPFPDPVSEDRPGFGPMEQTVVTALQGGAATVDALCVATDLSPKVLLGVVERLRRLGVLTIDGSEVAMVAPGEG
ncbi:MAG: hypothetical protein HKN24_07240, partial [Acidimicrobiales bacterium]|nr:hypothetical protein [Acidimicrobiales bacterium]